jgi:hypothetical protein
MVLGTRWGVGATHPDIDCLGVPSSPHKSKDPGFAPQPGRPFLKKAPDIEQNATSGCLMLSCVSTE